MRTRYFQNRASESSIKRVPVRGNVTYWSSIFRKWMPSRYSVTELKNTQAFNHITRDQARKIHPKGFSKAFGKGQ